MTSVTAIEIEEPAAPSAPIEVGSVSNCFHRVRARLYLSLAPSFNQDPIAGLKQQHLDPMLMTYNPELKGVVVSYFNIKLDDDTIAKVSNDTPFSFLWTTVDFLVWSPKVGDLVEGYVFMQSQSHIGLLIHDTFNATIKKYNVPTGWTFVPSQADENGEHRFGKSLGQWQDENGVPIEGKLQFTIKSLNPAGKVISVEGTLLDPSSELDIQPVTLEPVAAEAEKKDEEMDSASDSESDSEDDSSSSSSSDESEDDSGSSGSDSSDYKSAHTHNNDDSSESSNSSE